MNNFNCLFYLNILSLVLFLSCGADPDLPDSPDPYPVQPENRDTIPVDTIPVDTIPVDTIPNLISFLFRVEASITELEDCLLETEESELNGSTFLKWTEEDSILKVSFVLHDQLNILALVQDSLSEDKKRAWFSTIIDFIPDDDMEWSFSMSAKKDDFGKQDGRLSTLSQYANLSGKAFGVAPLVTLSHDLKFLEVVLPASVRVIECQGSFSSVIYLDSRSKSNDKVYFAVPQLCTTPIAVSAKNESDIVFRSAYVGKAFDKKTSNITRVSLVERQTFNAVIKHPYKSRLRGNFSGITRIVENNYAVVSDATESEGWYNLEIPIDDSGEIEYVSQKDFVMSYEPQRDLEDIVYNSSTNRVLLVAEDDNLITEHEITGERTGLTLSTSMFAGISANFGLESLTYNNITKRYWTTTEGGLECDGGCASAYRKFHRKNKLRLQSYLEDGSIGGFWFYETDSLQKNIVGIAYAFGVSALCALNDGRLLVMERETLVNLEIGEVGFSCIKIYIVDPTISIPETILQKELLIEINNTLSLSLNPATFIGDCINYEGMCLGPILPDGSQILLLVSDSQDNMCLSQDESNFVFRDTFLPIVLSANTIY